MDLRTYIDQERGRAAALASRMGVSQVLISQWASGRRAVPAERCIELEKNTDGHVSCEELRADIDWAFLRSGGSGAAGHAGCAAQ